MSDGHAQLPPHLIGLSKSELEGMCVDCGLCLSPDMRVLHADFVWRPIGDVQVGDVLLGFDEQAAWRTTQRKVRPTVVEYVHRAKKPTNRLVFDDREVVTTAEHRWLTARGWRRTDRLIPTSPVRDMGVHDAPRFSELYRLGYLAGMTEGDGTYRFATAEKRPYWRVALQDEEPIGRLVRYLTQFGLDVRARPFKNSATSFNPSCSMTQVGFTNKPGIGLLRRALEGVDHPEYARGFLAGLFDAEGSFHERHLRISQHGTGLLERAQRYGRMLGLSFQLEPHRDPRYHTLRLEGGLRSEFKFFTTCAPAIERKRLPLSGRALRTELAPARVVDGKPLDVVDIQTSTATFFVEGMATHNCCYASAPLNKGSVLIPDLRCKYLEMDGDTGKSCCSVYEQRHDIAKGWCLPLADAIAKGVFPEQCPYVRDMQDYVGSVAVSDATYDALKPPLQKALARGGKPEWVSDSHWEMFLTSE